MKKAQIKSIAITLFMTILFTVGVLGAFTITLNLPTTNYWSDSRDVDFNFTVVGNYTTYDSCTLYTNNSNSWRDESVTQLNAANDTSYLLELDDMNERVGIIWNVYCTESGETNFSSSNYTINIDVTNPVLALSYPSNGSYLNGNTPDFNITATDTNIDSCVLFLSNNTAQGITANKTKSSITSGSVFNITPSTMIDGTYKWNMQCNDSAGHIVNVSTTNYDLTIDTISPTHPNITSTWHQTNNTDTTPTLMWKTVTDTNFDKYVVEAINYSGGNVVEQINVSSRTTNYTTFVGLTTDTTYNFSVTAYDLAGNTAKSANTTDTLYYVDSVCGTLYAGWNVCGAVWTTPKNLSVIGAETSATFVTVWNLSHQWQTCIYGVSDDNCNVKVGISGNNLTSVWIYVDAQTSWRNRTWSATKLSANFTVINTTVGWNLFGNFVRNGLTFADLNASSRLNNVNITAYSLRDNSAGTNTPYITKSGFNSINKATRVEYGEALWVYYNETGNHTYDVGGW